MTIDTIEKAENYAGLFVGSPLAFSDATVKFASSELEGMRCVRTATLTEIQFMTPERTKEIRLIIVDEALTDELRFEYGRLCAIFPNANVALAYRSARRARELLNLAQQDPQLGRVSYLPMEKNLDCWLSILRLLALGQRYRPVGLTEPLASANATPPAPTDRPQVSADEVGFEPCSAPERTPQKARHAKDSPKKNQTKQLVTLTGREVQVLRAAAEGKQNKIIAAELNLSEHTVKLHMHHVIAKLGVHNRTGAAIWFHSQAAQDNVQ